MKRFHNDRDSDGATAVEYALMVTMIAVVIAGAVSLFGIQVAALFAPVMGAF